MSHQQVIGMDDPELRHSLRVIQRQRSTKLVGVIIGIVLAIVVAGLSVMYAYQDTPMQREVSGESM
ncbi:MAG: hypothetical protein R3B13_00125 [Polyangiaceae bacterium]